MGVPVVPEEYRMYIGWSGGKGLNVSGREELELKCEYVCTLALHLTAQRSKSWPGIVSKMTRFLTVGSCETTSDTFACV